MARRELLNGDPHLLFRTKLNEMFLELYAKTGSIEQTVELILEDLRDLTTGAAESVVDANLSNDTNIKLWTGTKEQFEGLEEINENDLYFYDEDEEYAEAIDSTARETLNNHLAQSVTQDNGVHGLEVEEGTWTPVLYGNTTAGTPAYSLRYGYYTKIGKLVHLSGRIDISAKGGLTGALRISGVPFTGANRTQSIHIAECHFLTFSDVDLPVLQLDSGAGYISFLRVRSNLSAANITESDIADSFSIRFTGVYRTN
jgi:hypothetical protein